MLLNVLFFNADQTGLVRLSGEKLVTLCIAPTLIRFWWVSMFLHHCVSIVGWWGWEERPATADISLSLVILAAGEKQKTEN